MSIQNCEIVSLHSVYEAEVISNKEFATYLVRKLRSIHKNQILQTSEGDVIT